MENITIPSGSTHGTRIRLSNQGICRINDYSGKKGDHIVEILIKIPK